GEIRLPARAQLAGFLLALLGPLQLAAFVATALLWPSPAPMPRCSLAPVADALDGLPAATVLIGVFDGPELLYRTHHRVIAGPYHHNAPGILDNYHAWLDDSADGGTAAAIVQRRGVAYVLGCTRFQSSLAGGDGRRTLARRVADGDVPPWLSPVAWPQGTVSDWRLYRVIEAQASALPSLPRHD
ncbi:MAG: hypothetical protein ACREVL_15385, partial [Solimonas sp.]